MITCQVWRRNPYLTISIAWNGGRAGPAQQLNTRFQLNNCRLPQAFCYAELWDTGQESRTAGSFGRGGVDQRPGRTSAVGGRLSRHFRATAGTGGMDWFKQTPAGASLVVCSARARGEAGGSAGRIARTGLDIDMGVHRFRRGG